MPRLEKDITVGPHRCSLYSLVGKAYYAVVSAQKFRQGKALIPEESQPNLTLSLITVINHNPT